MSYKILSTYQQNRPVMIDSYILLTDTLRKSEMLTPEKKEVIKRNGHIFVSFGFQSTARYRMSW